MKTILAQLSKEKAIKKIKKDIKKKDTPVCLSGCMEMALGHIIAAIGSEFRVNLVIAYDEIRARGLVEDLRLYGNEETLGECLYYPARDLLFYSADVHGNAIVKERLSVIRKLVEKEKVTIVTTLDAGMDHSLSFSMFSENRRDIRIGDTVDIDELKKYLTYIGYERVPKVEGEGEFSIRGGIVDIFPITNQWAYRLELFGDEVDSIRQMDVESQRSVEKADCMSIYPATEVFLNEDDILAGLKKMDDELKACVKRFRKDGKNEAATKLERTVNLFRENYEIYNGIKNVESYLPYFSDEVHSFFDYFDLNETGVFIDDFERTVSRAKVVEEEFSQSMISKLENGYILPKQADIIFSANAIVDKVANMPLVILSNLEKRIEGLDIKNIYNIKMTYTQSYNNEFQLLVQDVKKYKKKNYRIIILTATSVAGKRLCEDLADFDILAFYKRDLDRELVEGEVFVTKGVLRKGFECKDSKLVVITQGDIWGSRSLKQKKKRKKFKNGTINSIEDLKPGDYVVHESYGIGVYEGIEKIKVDHITKDYMKISYAGKTNLFIPATNMDYLQKYAGAGAEKKPKLNNLNTNAWKKTKSKVYQEIEGLAEELANLYAKRQVMKGYEFEKDTVWQTEFEEKFPYDETEDQMKAIEAVKADMESSKIMDRLICGDVGFGKTEVAIRAAFKAVMSGKQVAFLVPTTILASQHYKTFSSRMKDYGIEVEMMSRLRSTKENKKTMEGLKSGRVDIVIGTHKILGKDVKFKDLGLLIIDEEQRFGVRHKEKIKELRANIDVMVLTATPIPRTLQMSLTGIRDMSLIDEPPVERIPIQTFVIEKNDEVIRDAIVRELGRRGQVYYVYNRVEDIDRVAADVAKLVPEAEIAYAHGQMSKKELEDRMYSFISGDIDVLISTTIIETGLDIPNVNTILIDDADKFGLAQLYQLRGRVGRADRTAYAFLMYKRDKVLKEVALKRLETIKEFTELGSGFRISMRDLENRGGGQILSNKQHGQMEAIGRELYYKMLNNAVMKIKGGQTEEIGFETSIDLPVDAFIPSEYIQNEIEKIDMYKRIAGLANEDERVDLEEELEDRYGKIPTSVTNLLEIADIKRKAHRAGIDEIVNRDFGIRLYIHDKDKINPSKLPALIKKYDGKLRIIFDNKPYFVYADKSNVLADMKSIVMGINELKEEPVDKKKKGKHNHKSEHKEGKKPGNKSGNKGNNKPGSNKTNKRR